MLPAYFGQYKWSGQELTGRHDLTPQWNEEGMNLAKKWKLNICTLLPQFLIDFLKNYLFW